MQSIYEPATVSGFVTRINTLTPSSQRMWGKMDVAQMLAHCAVPIEISLGEREGKKTLMGMIFGKIAKGTVISTKPFKQSLPTNPDFIITDPKNFDEEKQRLIGALTRFSNEGAAKMDNRKHPFFGKLTATEWSNSTVKHIDHHLKQFGA